MSRAIVNLPNALTAVGLLLVVLGLLQLGTLSGTVFCLAGMVVCIAGLIVVLRANRRTR